MKIRLSILIYGLWMLFTACGGTQNLETDYKYFNDKLDSIAIAAKPTKIQANDQLTIIIRSSTLNQEQVLLFNPPISSEAKLPIYSITADGKLDLPLVGRIHAGGLSLLELQSQLVVKLADYIKSPNVTVNFYEININVIGEVRLPGIQKFNKNAVTIIDAISSAGDLTDFAERKGIVVLREIEGKQMAHYIDLRSKNIFSSPVYYLQPNDVVYVAPNKYKLKSINVDPQVQRRTSLIFSVTSVVVSLGTLIVLATR